MNELQIAYKRDTGKGAISTHVSVHRGPTSDFVWLDEFPEDMRTRNSIPIIYSPSYVLWLEEKLNNKTP
jgi:hypothetical protein